MKEDTQKIWLTWEDHRRSRELAAAFDAAYIPLLQKGNRFVRYPVLIVKTMLFLFRTHPHTVFCQNPSIVLNSLLCVMKPLFKFKLIADRHSNFKFHTAHSWNPKWVIFHLLSKYTLRHSDLVIVTNEYLKNFIEMNGGNAAILEDKIPNLAPVNRKALLGITNVVFISTFSDDEPIIEVLRSANLIPASTHIYITGNYKKYSDLKVVEKLKPKNVTLTGFLSETDYQSLLISADILMVITDQEHTLTCGAYEAVALEKPMILGNTQAIKSYFSKGAIYTGANSDSVAKSIIDCSQKIDTLLSEVKGLKSELKESWLARFDKVQTLIGKAD